MPVQLALIQQEDVGIAIAMIAAWLVYMCLRHVAGEMEYAIRRHNLHAEAKLLRIRQAERLRAINEYAG
jgi:hypothetical protein